MWEHAPLVPAKAGTQSRAKKELDARFRGHERVTGLLSRLALCAALAIAAPAACGAGDFGRPSPSLLEGLIPQQFWKGPVAGYSGAPLTDLEVELRDRSYVLIRPNEPRGRWNIYIAGFQIVGAFPPAYVYTDYTEYSRMLLWTPARSEASSYHRLIDDMAEDGKLTGPFVSVACAVADLDLKREQSLAYVGAPADWEVGNSLGRIRENRLITAWVHRALHWRLASYRFALERLVITVPSVLAVEAERALTRFQVIVTQADPALARCEGAEFQAAAAVPLVTK